MSWPAADWSTASACSSSRATASSPSPTPSGTCSWRWLRPCTTTPSGNTSTRPPALTPSSSRDHSRGWTPVPHLPPPPPPVRPSVGALHTDSLNCPLKLRRQPKSLRKCWPWIVYCFLTEENRIFFWPTKATFKKLFCTTSARGGSLDFFSNEPWPIHECLRNLIAVFCITWIESHSTSGVIFCVSKTWRFHPFQLVIWPLGDVEWGALKKEKKSAGVRSRAGYHHQKRFTYQYPQLYSFWYYKHLKKKPKNPQVAVQELWMTRKV